MKLHNLINEELWNKIKTNSVYLQENQNKKNRNSLKSIYINEIPENVFLVELDKKIDNQGIFNNLLNRSVSKINKSCDGIFLHYKNKNSVDLLFCELKSKTIKANAYENQLMNTKLFIDYLIKIFNCFENKNLKIENIKFVLFYLDKRRSMQTRKTLRQKTKNIYFPSITKEKMINFSKNYIIKCPSPKDVKYSINWDKLII